MTILLQKSRFYKDFTDFFIQKFFILIFCHALCKDYRMYSVFYIGEDRLNGIIHSAAKFVPANGRIANFFWHDRGNPGCASLNRGSDGKKWGVADFSTLYNTVKLFCRQSLRTGKHVIQTRGVVPFLASWPELCVLKWFSYEL